MLYYATLVRLSIGYPDAESERQILRGAPARSLAAAEPVLSGGDVVAIQDQVQQVAVDEAIAGYLLAIVGRTRNHDGLLLGASPRGAQALFRATQALAVMAGRDYAIPDDVKQLAVPVLAHRVVVNSRTSFETRGVDAAGRILEDILRQVDVPL